MWEDVLLYVVIGFVAQMIDGTIGMAYGVTASSVSMCHEETCPCNISERLVQPREPSC